MESEILKISLGNALKINMDRGDEFYSEPGSFIFAEGDFEVKSSLGYGYLGLITRPMGGESPFINRYKAKKRSTLVVGPKRLGGIEGIELKGNLLVRDGAYLGHEGEIEIGAQFGGITSLVAGSGLFFMVLKGRGKVYINGDKYIFSKKLKKGEEIYIDNTSFLAADDSVTFRTKTFGDNLITKLFGGEGLILKITGPGRVYYQAQSKGYLSTLIERWLSNE